METTKTYTILRCFFQRNFDVYNKSGAACPTYSTEQLILEHTPLIQTIDQFIGLSHETFTTYHLDIITRFAKMVQRIPDPLSDNLLFHSTLKNYVNFLKYSGKGRVNTGGHLTNYSLLVAIICQQISNLLCTYSIYFQKDKQEYKWDPFGGVLTEQCKTFRLVKLNIDSVNNNVNRTLIFSFLVARKGQDWLIQDQSITSKLNQFISGHARLSRPEQVLDSHYKDDIALTQPNTLGKNDPEKTQHIIEITKKLKSTCDLLDSYITWINNGLSSGSIRINQPGARFHVVNEGLLIAAPAAFMDYERVSGIPWKKIQTIMLRQRWHKRDENNRNFQSYIVQGKIKRSKINGIVIGNPLHIIKDKIPQPNSYLNPVL